MATDYPDHPFWDFSLSVYAKPDVPRACIAVQDRHIIDVNFLLLGTWYGHAGFGSISDEAMEKADGIFRPWNQEIVCALRATRDRLKAGYPGVPTGHSDAMRKAVLSLEVECEHIEHLAMAEILDQAGEASPDRAVADRLGDSILSFARYFSVRSVTMDDVDIDDLTIILTAAYEECAPTDISTQLRSVLIN